MTERPAHAYIPRPVGLDAELFRLTAASGILRLQRCDNCDAVQHPPRFLCGSCASRNMGWVEAAGSGTVYSWAMSHFAIDKAWEDSLPYAVVVVETTEGVRVVGNYAGDDNELKVGLPLMIRIEPVGDTFAHLWFDRDRSTP